MENKDFELIEMEPETNVEAETNENGIGTMTAMAIGAGLTACAIAGWKKVKKVLANRKSKGEEVVAEATEVVEEEVSEEKKSSKPEKKTK